MKKHYATFLIILSFILGDNAEIHAQQDISNITCFPTERSLDYGNIDNFFTELKEWSKLYRNGVVVNEDYNAIFVKHFKEEYMAKEQPSRFISLPMTVEVTRYDYDLKPYADKILGKKVLPVAITSFTPVLDSDEEVVYISEKAEKLLSDFLEEPAHKVIKTDGTSFKDYRKVSEKDWMELRKRIALIEEYVPTSISHWDEFWYFLSYPQITSFIVGNDGYIINIGRMTYYGDIYFVPWDGEPEVINTWIS